MQQESIMCSLYYIIGPWPIWALQIREDITRTICGKNYNRPSRQSPEVVEIALSDEVERSPESSDFVLIFTSGSNSTTSSDSLVNGQLSFLYHSLAKLGEQELDVLHQELCLEQERLWYAQYHTMKQRQQNGQLVREFILPGKHGRPAINQVSVDLTVYS